MSSRLTIAAVATALSLGTIVSACLSDFAFVDDGVGGDATSAGGGGANGGGGQGGTASGTSDGGGGAEPMLISRGLVVRYHLDEAASGKDPALAIDAAGSLDLVHDWSGDVHYVEVDGHRGLRWESVGPNGGPNAPANGTPVEAALTGATEATIEIVADIEEASAGPPRSHVFGISPPMPSAGALDISARNNAKLRLGFNSNVAAVWDRDPGRIVTHVVVDTTASSAAARRAVYVDGSPVALDDPEAPLLDETIPALMGFGVDIGSRPGNAPSMKGNVFYAAIYAVALTEREVANNAGLLLADDDAPR